MTVVGLTTTRWPLSGTLPVASLWSRLARSCGTPASQRWRCLIPYPARPRSRSRQRRCRRNSPPPAPPPGATWTLGCRTSSTNRRRLWAASPASLAASARLAAPRRSAAGRCSSISPATRPTASAGLCSTTAGRRRPRWWAGCAGSAAGRLPARAVRPAVQPRRPALPAHRRLLQGRQLPAWRQSGCRCRVQISQHLDCCAPGRSLAVCQRSLGRLAKAGRRWSRRPAATPAGPDEFFFLTDPWQHLHLHLPDDKRWQLLRDPVAMAAFVRMPLLRSPFFNAGLRLLDWRSDRLEADADTGWPAPSSRCPLEPPMASGRPVS
ncbi:hypothetical protein BOX15_Mlig016852g3 [Macrostomum lignano]|uniref:Uncharacterized protein n=1 Tax=Macrostomum lignano TaxID=282301 RepID=A0A267DB14_9PLAT|nr:hypothetical protein BOX15_Mlig016852g3 [Macrostomum lignano]